jgi:hypothetical protein
VKTASGFDHTYQEFNDNGVATTVKVTNNDPDRGGALPLDANPFATAPLAPDAGPADDRLANALAADLAWMDAEIFAPRIWSTHADETLAATARTDIIMLTHGFGHDKVTGFQGGPGRGDVLMFAETDFADVGAVMKAARQVGGDVVITVDPHNDLVLRNITLANLSADDFRFFG